MLSIDCVPLMFTACEYSRTILSSFRSRVNCFFHAVIYIKSNINYLRISNVTSTTNLINWPRKTTLISPHFQMSLLTMARPSETRNAILYSFLSWNFHLKTTGLINYPFFLKFQLCNIRTAKIDCFYIFSYLIDPSVLATNCWLWSYSFEIGLSEKYSIFRNTTVEKVLFK